MKPPSPFDLPITENNLLRQAIAKAADQMAKRQATALDDAIKALLVAGVPLSAIEIHHYPHGVGTDTTPVTRVVQRH